MSNPTGQPNDAYADSPRAEPTGVGERSNGSESSSGDEVATLTRECDDLREQVLRARAEFANYQKRSKQQGDNDRLYAAGSLAKDLLDPLDNLSRAVNALRSSGVEGITAGLDMVQRQLLDVLAKHGVEPIEAIGTTFDPNFHEALLQQPTADQPEGMVVGEMGKGYKIRDRVLRPSKVAVSARPASG